MDHRVPFSHARYCAQHPILLSLLHTIGPGFIKAKDNARKHGDYHASIHKCPSMPQIMPSKV